ncbi:MAG: hypothetical protein MRY59_00945 [Aquisalinus sp.]|nr:hypothetical protein [Aquisalinus sp.]
MLKGLAVIGIRLIALKTFLVGGQAFMAFGFWPENGGFTYYIYSALNLGLAVVIWCIAPRLGSILVSGTKDIELETSGLTDRTIIRAGSFLIGLYMVVNSSVILAVSLPDFFAAISGMSHHHSSTFGDTFTRYRWDPTFWPEVGEFFAGSLLMVLYYFSSNRRSAE